jgi:hypothetical protein
MAIVNIGIPAHVDVGRIPYSEPIRREIGFVPTTRRVGDGASLIDAPKPRRARAFRLGGSLPHGAVDDIDLLGARGEPRTDEVLRRGRAD